MARPFKNPNLDAVKALVTIYGPSEASKLSGVPIGTIQGWCYRYKWRMAKNIPKPKSNLLISGKDAGDAIADAMARHKQEAEVNLAHYAAKAAKRAVQHGDPLKIARNVRDAAAVYRTVFPPEEGGEMVEGAILVGGARVTDNPTEMLAAAEVIEDVREELPDQRPESH